jgi:hypothetical protein
VNIKRGLKRVWLVGSILWALWCIVISNTHIVSDPEFFWPLLIGPILIAWVLLYVGFWINSGFKEN